MRILVRILKDCLTIKNGQDWCFAKTSAFVSLIIYFPMAIFMMVKNVDHFSLSEFALGIGTILGASAASAKIKETTEPE